MSAQQVITPTGAPDEKHVQPTNTAVRRKRRSKRKPPVYKLQQKLATFWGQQSKAMAELRVEHSNDFKSHNDLPKARIKRIMQVMMQADDRCPHVRMIRAEAPILFAKACEMFILELSLHAYGFSVRRQRKNLNKDDIRHAVRATKTLDFIDYILSEQDSKKQPKSGAFKAAAKKSKSASGQQAGEVDRLGAHDLHDSSTLVEASTMEGDCSSQSMVPSGTQELFGPSYKKARQIERDVSQRAFNLDNGGGGYAASQLFSPPVPPPHTMHFQR